MLAFDAWGLEKALKESIGMFSFALWDKKEKTLSLVNDRVGEKPIYYGQQNGVFLFGSELTAIRKHPSFEGIIDKSSVSMFLKMNYIPHPHSIFKGISKLNPGCLIKIKLNGKEFEYSKKIEYWSLEKSVLEGKNEKFNGSDVEAVDTLEKILKDSISGQMISDVPLGAFLSGGIDSSCITAIMQSMSSDRVKTFSIGFDEKEYDEAVYAKKVASFLGTEHTKLTITPLDALQVIPRMPSVFDEPFADSSQIPTLLLAELTRKKVKVSLSGDGGDELFGGYNRYIFASNLWNKISIFPRPVRRLISRSINTLSISKTKLLIKIIESIIWRRQRTPNLEQKIKKVMSILSCNDLDEFYEVITTNWANSEELIKGLNLVEKQDLKRAVPVGLSSIEKMMYLDLKEFLPGDILVKVDRTAMAVSLETRVPFLDHRVIDFSMKLPFEYKIRNGQGKWILRELLHKYLPKNLIDRPKMGFGVPLSEWLRGPLKEWLYDLLNEDQIKREGIFDHKPIKEKLNEHFAGKGNWENELWNITMFQAWLSYQRS